MFITREEINIRTGLPVTQETLVLAQAMIEAYIGRDETEITNSSDKATLAKATMFQSIYIRTNTDIVLEQASVTSLSQNETVVKFNPDMFAPFMSPWAVLACRRLSWVGTRSVTTGAIFGNKPYALSWERN